MKDEINPIPLKSSCNDGIIMVLRERVIEKLSIRRIKPSNLQQIELKK